jgi:hypothetical protein
MASASAALPAPQREPLPAILAGGWLIGQPRPVGRSLYGRCPVTGFQQVMPGPMLVSKIEGHHASASGQA